MKIFYSLPSITLLTLISTAPCFAISQAPSRMNSQSEAAPSSVTKVAGFLDGLNRVINTGDRLLDTVEQETTRQRRREQENLRQRERQERFEAEQIRQEAINAERLAAAEERRLLVEQQRIMFQNMTPEQQQNFIAEQQRLQAEKQQRQVDVLNGVANIVVPMLMNSGGSEANQAPNPADDMSVRMSRPLLRGESR